MPAATAPTTHSQTLPRLEAKDHQRISSFEKKAEKKGRPEMAMVANMERPESDRHVLAQPAHVAHVLLAGEGVDDRTGTEEQTGFEEGVGHQVENARTERPHAHGQEHVAELGDGRVRQNPLDIVLRHADAGGEDRRQRHR